MQRLTVRLASILLLSALSPLAVADILRCGSSLIQVGDPQEAVLRKCGEPQSTRTVSEPVWIRAADGTLYQTGVEQWELWRYNRGPRQFPAILKIADGLVRSIEFEKSPGAARQ